MAVSFSKCNDMLNYAVILLHTMIRYFSGVAIRYHDIILSIAIPSFNIPALHAACTHIHSINHVLTLSMKHLPSTEILSSSYLY
mmetsp:Transcript_24920/g.42336  ORF Transcript_24920/g.42336 Transcript_24920/m.42336 type:complete len:84 (+) Transcript_24920:20-271(+)